MDYDRYDALLHWLFKQTQGDAWFRPHEENLSSGVALRISTAPVEFRIFPYENRTLEPFEAAVTALNPAVAVKVRSAAAHAALAELSPDESSIRIDSDTMIQVIDTMLYLPNAERDQGAAFIRDERVLVIWSDSLELIRLLWRTKPAGTTTSSLLSAPSSVRRGSGLSGRQASSLSQGMLPEGGSEKHMTKELQEENVKSGKGTFKRTWYGRRVYVPSKESDLEAQGPEKREAKIYSPIYNGIAAGLSTYFMGQGLKKMLMEWVLDNNYVRFALCATMPLLWCVSLFFALQLVQNVTMAFGPIAHYHENSMYYSAVRPRVPKEGDGRLPHVTIQMPVYKESLESVLTPSILSLKKAMQTYARQGGTSHIFVCDDGLRLLPQAERDERIAFYADNNIGWVARPKHEDSKDGFHRAGRFKKASNMNFGLALSLKAEKHLKALMAERGVESEGQSLAALMSDRNQTSLSSPVRPFADSGSRRHSNLSGFSRGESASHIQGALVQPARYGIQYLGKDGDDQTIRLTDEKNPSSFPVDPESTDESLPNGSPAPVEIVDLEEKALQMAMDETSEESNNRWRPWAANGKATRIGEYILIVDSDTVVPEDCLRDAAREMRECPTVAIIQHESDVMQVAHHYFENGIAYFTRRINRCISMACANGEVAPFMGHNAFLRWKAIQDAAFIDTDGQEKIWSESNVSEDFDMALRLMLKGYIVRWATYSNGGFKEGVSLSVADELNRWQKYAYGCNELLFNPFVQWWRKGPIAHQIHHFLWCSAPFHYKISMMAYMFSYCTYILHSRERRDGIAAAMTIGVINYIILGFELPVDNFYMASFEIWLATTVVFLGSGNVGYTFLEYRLGHKQLLWGLLENLMWVPFFFVFFGGLGIPISQALLAHLFSIDISWGATIKEVERSNFFKEIPLIVKRFWFSLTCALIVITGMIILSTNLVPYAWRVDGSAWAVIFPLSIVSGCHILFPVRVCTHLTPYHKYCKCLIASLHIFLFVL
ncbi:hypothetical protein FISHEDRAFT_63947 [Fistulina hepatica ATCC 64428]|uniref:Uncharacterized protein n=1 Tax=Fistulina hepatica ATCC 64428 TaxID=1128425 RepID=A0A0D7AK53_9AGAR|nr:hypothetical protein FISHEDRAFT_63947 [Fistulina hepatica ATCC 64428]